MRINSNIMAFNAQRNLGASATSIGKSLEKLSSGFRINRAADDASGLVVSQGLRAQVSGLKQAGRNAQDGISVVQTAEGALTEVHSMLNRMRDLAVQAANTGTQDANATKAAQAEFVQLREEIDRIAGDTKFGSKNLLSGTFGVQAGKISGFDADNSYTIAASDSLSFTVTGGGGARTAVLTAGTYTGDQLAAHITSAVEAAFASSTNAADRAFADTFKVESLRAGAGNVLSFANSGGATVALANGAGTPLAALGVTAGTIAASTGTAAKFQVGANAGETIDLSIAAVNSTTLAISALSVETGASAAITALDTAIAKVSEIRGDLGAKQNRFESTISNLQVATENLAASESRIRDTDMAAEMVNFTKNQILQQAGTAMLAQANQLPQGILRLLG